VCWHQGADELHNFFEDKEDRMRRIVVASVISLLALPLVGAAQEQAGPMTWLAYSQLAEGKMGQHGFEVVMKDKEMMDALLADGVIAGHGVAIPANNRPGDKANFLEWVSVADWGKVQQWVGRVMAKQQSMSEDEHNAMAQAYAETFVPGSHYDEVVRNAIFSPAAPGEMEKVQVFYVGSYTSLEGKSEAFMELVLDQAVPIADKLVEDGVAIAYGMHVPEIHGVEGWTHRIWWALPSLEGIGQLKAAYAAAAGDTQTRVDDLTVPGSHFDTIYVSMYVGMPPTQ
jgi:hypothetical protein